MRTEIAEKAGFCFGVARAVKIACENAGTETETVTYGALIHNRDVTDDLEKKGVKMVNSVEEIEPGMNVIIRAHGIPKEEQKKIEAKGAKITDATCPYVKKIHSIVSDAYSRGRSIIIVGDPNHPEVKGINGWCDNKAYVVNSEE